MDYLTYDAYGDLDLAWDEDYEPTPREEELQEELTKQEAELHMLEDHYVELQDHCDEARTAISAALDLLDQDTEHPHIASAPFWRRRRIWRETLRRFLVKARREIS